MLSRTGSVRQRSPSQASTLRCLLVLGTAGQYKIFEAVTGLLQSRRSDSTTILFVARDERTARGPTLRPPAGRLIHSRVSPMLTRELWSFADTRYFDGRTRARPFPRGNPVSHASLEVLLLG